MDAPAPHNSLPLVFARLLIGWAIGGALYFFTLVVTVYDAVNTFVTGIVGGAIVSAIGVAACAIAGFYSVFRSSIESGTRLLFPLVDWPSSALYYSLVPFYLVNYRCSAKTSLVGLL